MVYAPGFGDAPPGAYEAGGFPVPGYYGEYGQITPQEWKPYQHVFPGWQRGIQLGLTPQEYEAGYLDYFNQRSFYRAKGGEMGRQSPLEDYLFGYSDTPPEGYTSIPLGGGAPGAAGAPMGRGDYGGGYGAPQQGFKPAEPTAGATYAAALPQFEPPAMEQYYRGQTSPMYQRFLGTAAEAQRQAEESIRERPTDVWGPRGQERGYMARLLEYQYPEEFKQLMAKEITPGMPASQVDWTGGTTLGPTAESSRVAWLESQPEYKELTRRAGTSAGAFESYLGQYPWLEEYQRIPPRQRGEYTAQYQPQTRWLMY